MKLSAWVLLCSMSLATKAAAQEQPPPPPLRPAECVPTCRSGYFCHDGQCVSRCNPPCASGTTCLENGECAAAYLPLLSVLPDGRGGTTATLGLAVGF